MNNVVSVSEQLKKRRLEMGLSVYDLAMIADIFPTTISGYGNGWIRFATGALRELAMALYCRFHVKLSPFGHDIGVFWNGILILKSLNYFQDAEREPMPVMPVPVRWDECKAYFIRAAHGIVLI